MLNSLCNRSFLDLTELNPQSLRGLLNLAVALKRERKARIFPRRMQNLAVALIFEKPSTRTRCSFVVACHEEGALASSFGPHEIHLGKKEDIRDTARVMGRMFAGIQFRGFEQGTATALAKHAGIPVWNGLTDAHHPTQAVADLFTLFEQFGPLKDLPVTYLGDARNNVAHSLAYAAALAGADFRVAAPRSLWPEQSWWETCLRVARTTGARLSVSESVTDAIRGACAIYTDVWVSMGEERLKGISERVALLRPYQVNEEVLRNTGRVDTVFLHCLPAVRGNEVSEAVLEGTRSLVFEQAENRLHTIKAVMLATLGLATPT